MAISLAAEQRLGACDGRSEEHTSELQSHRDLHSFPTRRSSDLPPHAPGMEAHPDEICNGLRHGYLLGCGTTFGRVRWCRALLEGCVPSIRGGNLDRRAAVHGGHFHWCIALLRRERAVRIGTAPERAPSEPLFSVVVFPACM